MVTKVDYLITVTKYQKTDYVSKAQLDEITHYLCMEIHSFRLKDWAYENSGMYSQLHLHGICEMGAGVRYSKYTRVFDFKIQYTKITNMKGAKRYIHKEAYDICSQQEILALNRYQDYIFV